MFEFLKRIFKKEEPIPNEEVKLENISKWFREKTRPVIIELKAKISSRLQEIKDILKRLADAVDSFEKAEVKEPEKIPEQVKNIVLGHRDNYIRVLRNGLLSIEIPAKISSKTVNKFCSNANNYLNQIAQSSIKSHYTSQHLFSEHTDAITRIIREISNSINAINECVNEKKILDIRNIKKQLSILNEKYSRKQDLLKQLDEFNSKLDEAKNLRTETETKIANLLKCDDFMQLKNEQDMLKAADETIDRSKRFIVDRFSPLEPILRRYSKVTIENEALVKGYAENPVKMLVEDKSLKIINVLEKLRKDIASDSIEFGDKKKDKLLEKIDVIKKDEIEGIMRAYTANVNKKTIILQNFSSSKVLSERRILDNRLKSAETMIEKITEEIKKLEKNVESANQEISNQKKTDEEMIKEALRIKADIIIA